LNDFCHSSGVDRELRTIEQRSVAEREVGVEKGDQRHGMHCPDRAWKGKPRTTPAGIPTRRAELNNSLHFTARIGCTRPPFCAILGRGAGS
jgi:hypothetical protein